MQDLLIYILYFRTKYTLNGFVLLSKPLFFINCMGGNEDIDMNTIITAGFESFENADRALSEIRRINPGIYCDETTAQNTVFLNSPPFVVPIAPDYFRIYPVANNDYQTEDAGSAKLNIMADSKYQGAIERVIRHHRGSIENRANLAQ